MLPNISQNYKMSEISIDMSSKVLGRQIKINKNNIVLDDNILKQFSLIEKNNFKFVYDQSNKLLDTLNYEGVSSDIVDLIPQSIFNKTILEFNTLINKNSINSYFFKILNKRYELTKKIKTAQYDHTSSITGRMKIPSGINYLIMKKENRKLIDVSPDNHLLEIDIKACEPALLHAVLYNETPDDIYSLFGSNMPRKKVKIAVISSIYGSVPSRVRKTTGLPLSEIKKIQDHFQLKKIKEFINKKFQKEGYFSNLYGRPIKDNSSPVNYWVQSSAADYACLAFLNLVNRGSFKLKACIHDAIIIEVNKKEYNSIKNIDKIWDPVSNIKLKVEQTLIK